MVAFILGVGILAAFSIVFRTWHLITNPGISLHYGLRKLVTCRFDTMMTGVLCSFLFRYYPGVWKQLRRYGLATGGVLILVCAYLAANYLSELWVKYMLIPLLAIGCGLLVASLGAIQSFGKTPTSRAFETCVRSISLWSYSAYLCNVLVMELLASLRGGYIPGRSRPGDIAWALLFLGLTFLISRMCYRAIELPWITWRNRRLPEKVTS